MRRTSTRARQPGAAVAAPGSGDRGQHDGRQPLRGTTHLDGGRLALAGEAGLIPEGRLGRQPSEDPADGVRDDRRSADPERDLPGDERALAPQLGRLRRRCGPVGGRCATTPATRRCSPLSATGARRARRRVDRVVPRAGRAMLLSELSVRLVPPTASTYTERPRRRSTRARACLCRLGWHHRPELRLALGSTSRCHAAAGADSSRSQTSRHSSR